MDNLPSGKYRAENAILAGSEFGDVDLANARFDDVNLSAAMFENVNLAGSTFEDVNLSHVKISNANYEAMTLDGILVTELFKAYEARNAD